MKGSILVETALALGFVILPLTAFFFDLIRLSERHALLHHICFMYTRARALGDSEAVARADAIGFYRGVLPEKEIQSFHRALHTDTEKKGDKILGRVRYRYAGWFSLFHVRFQVTKRCPFYLSSWR